jgi:LysM repeat protein
MLNHRTRRYQILGCAALLLFLSGCFQSAGTNPDALSVAQSGPTFTPFPTDVPQEQVVVVTATQDPNALIQQFPTVDPNISGAIIPTVAGGDPNNTGFLVQPEQSNLVIDPLDMTATFIIAGATATQAAFITQTAVAQFGFPIATATPPQLLATSGPVVSGADCVHEVRAEDRNLYRISLVYGVTVAAIAQASSIANPNQISISQKLVIPGCGTTGARPPATSVPTTGGTIGQATPIPVGGPVSAGSTYVVQQGDTLFAISLQTGVPVVSIANANGITDIDRIFINQQLVIPAG